MMGRTHALSGLVTGVAIGQFGWHLDPAHLAVGAAVTAGAAVLIWLVAVVEKVVPAGRLPLH